MLSRVGIGAIYSIKYSVIGAVIGIYTAFGYQIYRISSIPIRSEEEIAPNTAFLDQSLLYCTSTFASSFGIYGFYKGFNKTQPTENNEEADPQPVANTGSVNTPISATKPVAEDNDNIHEKALKDAGYQGEIPEEFLDVITLCIIHKPAILDDGNLKSQAISADTAATLLNRKQSSPFNRQPFHDYTEVTNYEKAIDAWVKKKVEEEEKKPLHQRPRKISKARLLQAQSLFNNRKPKSPAQSEQVSRDFLRKSF